MNPSPFAQKLWLVLTDDDQCSTLIRSAYIDIDANAGWRRRTAQIKYLLTFRLENMDMGRAMIVQEDHNLEPILAQHSWQESAIIKAIRYVNRLQVEKPCRLAILPTHFQQPRMVHI
ncbi:MAG: hypothetical protein R6W76_12915 [Caldilinea sp.]